MTVTIIAAIAKDNVIGSAGDIPWRLPSDQQRFKDLTMGHPVIMGRLTYESLPQSVRPLPGRHNIVVSRDPGLELTGCTVLSNLVFAIRFANANQVFIIGGGEVYAQALAIADRLLITRIDAEIPGDSHFPRFDQGWKLTEQSQPVEENGFTFCYETYERE